MDVQVSPKAQLTLPLGLVVLIALVCLNGGRALAQAASADYTADLPSVARVEAEIKGTDPTDTLARQVAVFNYLLAIIDRTKYGRTVTGPYTPSEQKMYAAYSGAGAQIAKDYATSHTAAEATAFNQLHGRYEMDETFNDAWQKQLIGPQATAAYNGAVSSLAAGQAAHVAQEQQQYQQDTAAQQAGASGMSSDPTSAAARRCLELGGSNGACLGSSLIGGIISTFTGGVNLGVLTATRVGVVLSGVYGQSTGGVPFLTFSGDSATITNCGKLVADGHGYNLVKSAGTLKVNVVNDPSPVVLTMRTDGSLAGPGMVKVAGRIITGYHTVTTTQMINGARAAPNQCNGPCQTVSQVPDYANATASCSIGSLSAPSPPPPSAGADSDSSAMGGLLGALTGMMGSAAVASLPGLRMEGKYSSSSGLILDFAGDAVTMDCGQAHVKASYTVVNGPTSFSINVQNSGGPFTLMLGSNNTLSGSGSTTVNGRLVSGMNGDNVTFTPHSESCAVATLTPQNADSSSSVMSGPSVPVTASAPAASAPVARASTAPVSPVAASASGMKVSVTSTFPTATNALAGKRVMLMTTTFDKMMIALGAPIPVGTTPGKALQAYAYACNPPKDCSALAPQMAKYEVGAGNFDNTGKVVLAAPVAAGTYYVFCSVAGTKGVLVWDMPIALKAGDNTINLTATNAELVPLTATQ